MKSGSGVSLSRSFDLLIDESGLGDNSCRSVFYDFHLALAPKEEAKLVALAEAKGLSTSASIREALEKILADAPDSDLKKALSRSSRGILAKYGAAPSAEEIDQNPFAEMVYLIEKERIPANALDDILAAVADTKNVLRKIPLDDTIAVAMRQVPRHEIADLPDRIIAATALLLGIPVLSRDGQLQASSIRTIR